jgi:hypothetical protein
MFAEQLSKEDEEAAGEEIEVRREDQDKINKFSRLHQHELTIEEELTMKNVSAAALRRGRPIAKTVCRRRRRS